MKRAVIYARVSRAREESVSIEAQIEHCTARAQALGASVVQVFLDDSISGREARNRTAFLKAKAYCQAANVDYFITWSTARFARNLLELFLSERELKDVGTSLVCLNADIDDETDVGFVNKAINGLMDEMYSRSVARDTLRSQKHSAAAGFFTGGRLPYGYQTVPDGARRRLALDAGEAPVVERIFRLAGQGHGVLAIALELNASGQLRRGKRWGKNNVNAVLTNEIYKGVKTFNKTKRRGRKVNPRSEWIQIASHPAIVTTEEFDKVQAQLEERVPHRLHGGARRSQWLFVGLMKCGLCGGNLQIRTGKSRSGDVYSYYACLGHERGAARCMCRAMRADVFDAWLLDQVLEKVITPASMKEAVLDLATAGVEWVEARARRRADLVDEIREVESRQNKLFDLLETHGTNTPDLDNVMKRLRERSEALGKLQDELAALEAAPPPGKAPNIDPQAAVDVMRDIILNCDAQKKRAFVGAFLERITLAPDGVTVEYHPEALINAGLGTSVRSTNSWLPVRGSLRTKTVCFPRPGRAVRGHATRPERVQSLTRSG